MHRLGSSSIWLALLVATVVAYTTTETASSSPSQGSQQNKDSLPTFISAKKLISALPATLKLIENNTSIAVAFPAKLPADNSQYYLSWEAAPDGKSYSLSIDLTPTCRGAKYCRAGVISAAKGKTPHKEKTMTGDKTLSVEVNLANQIKGYFTPGHAKADYWPPMVEWSADDILYHVSWAVPDHDEKQTLLTLANLTIDSLRQ